MGRHEQFDQENQGAHGPWDRSRFLHFLHLSMRHRFLYCSTPKVACSSLLMTLQRIEAQDLGFLHDPWGEVHYREFSPLLMPLQVPSFRDWMLDPAVFKFCFVRNPFSRLLSAYLDKIVMTEGFRAKFRAALGRDEGGITFAEFIDVVAAESDEEMDDHYSIQYRHTFQSRIPYDYIGRFEALPAGMAEVGRRIGVDMRAYEARVDSHRTGAHDYAKYYTPRMTRLVQDRFAEDFSAFGYRAALP